MPVINTTRSFDFSAYAAANNPFTLENLPSVRQALESMPTPSTTSNASIFNVSNLTKLPSWQIALGAFAITGLAITILKRR